MAGVDRGRPCRTSRRGPRHLTGLRNRPRPTVPRRRWARRCRLLERASCAPPMSMTALGWWAGPKESPSPRCRQHLTGDGSPDRRRSAPRTRPDPGKALWSCRYRSQKTRRNEISSTRSAPTHGGMLGIASQDPVQQRFSPEATPSKLENREAMLAVTVTKRPTVAYRSRWMATAPQ